MKLTQDQIEKIAKVSNKTISILLWLICILFLIKAICFLLEYVDVPFVLNEEQFLLASHIYDYVLLCVGILFLIAALVNIPSEMIIRREKKSEEAIRSQAISPLLDVTPKQEEEIIRVLKRVARSSDGTNKMNKSEVATFLVTLKQELHLDDNGDFNNIRLWVEEVTGTRDTDTQRGHFKEAYKRAFNKVGDTKYTLEVKRIFEQKG